MYSGILNLYMVAEPMGYLAFFSICLFVAFFSLGIGPINWVITSEVFPNKVVHVLKE